MLPCLHPNSLKLAVVMLLQRTQHHASTGNPFLRQPNNNDGGNSTEDFRANQEKLFVINRRLCVFGRVKMGARGWVRKSVSYACNSPYCYLGERGRAYVVLSVSPKYDANV